MNFNIKNEIKIYNYIKMAPISDYIINTLNFIPNIKASMNITQIKYIL